MRTRHLLSTAVAVALALPATASSSITRPDGVSAPLPGVGQIDALRVCTQDAGASPICQRVATPEIKSGRVTANWKLGVLSGVSATPAVLTTSQCGHRPAVGLRVAVSRIATDITMAVTARYAGVDAQRTVVSVTRRVDVGKDTTLWVCAL